MSPIRTGVVAIFLVALLAPRSLVADDRADALARDVVRAAGGDVWPRVRVLRFTFTVTEGPKTIVTARHVWDVRAMTDTVTWNDRTVTVDLRNPAQDEDAKAAFGRWTNDSYWLLAPLKLMDPGVRREYGGERDGLQVLRVSFDDVGLTPRDRYDLLIDPQTKLVRRWVYMPTPDKQVPATWEEYQVIDGLTLSTFHTVGDRTILFERVDAEVE